MNIYNTLRIGALAAALVMTGCASKKALNGTTAITSPNGSAANNGNTSNDSSNNNGGVNSRSLPSDPSLSTQILDPNDPRHPDNPNNPNNPNNPANVAKAALNKRLVHFDYDSSDIAEDDLPTLNAHARYLGQNKNAKVVLAGHTDERGTREYNMALGERRAKAVQVFLVTNGASSSQLDTVSYGKEVPINEGHDDDAWAENRRVELKYDSGQP